MENQHFQWVNQLFPWIFGFFHRIFRHRGRSCREGREIRDLPRAQQRQGLVRHRGQGPAVGKHGEIPREFMG